MSGAINHQARPSGFERLRARLALLFNVGEDAVLPVRGVAHAATLVAGLDAARLVDERGLDWTQKPTILADRAGDVSYREITDAEGRPAPLCGVLIGAPKIIGPLADLVGQDGLHPLLCAEALKALSPVWLALREARRLARLSERSRVVQALHSAPGVSSVREDGDGVIVAAREGPEILRRGMLFDAALAAGDDGSIKVLIGEAQANDRALAAFGAEIGRRPRIGEAIRETKETTIAVRVDLDRVGDVRINTGVAYFDHMLEQVAAHGGLSLTLACEGDTHVDLHHTIEDCALALGSALSNALGERRGIARYGFTLPMDEAEARVSIDLGGRPYAVFEGVFAAPLLGRYPTEMTAHVFRSLAQTLGAAVHVSVYGENDHHKTEACFKAFARALRMAVAVEGDMVPSTKGVL